ISQILMADCYTAAGAPLNALANQLLGESSFSAKSSHFRQIPDLDLIAAWDQQEQWYPNQDQVQTTLSGVATASRPEFSTLEFEKFSYTPAIVSPTQDTSSSTWTREWSRQQGAESDDDEDDDGDEFREEWSNDHFTQAYISSHQSKFKEIEEQDRLKEARLEQERERQRQQVSSGGPPRSTWMMAGAVSTVTETAGVNMGPKRLRVPGIDSFDPAQPFVSATTTTTAFSVDEFMSFDYQDNNNMHLQSMNPLKHQQQEPKPIRSEDRFLSLVSDLQTAEQIYYPGATSAMLPELSELESDDMQPVVSFGGGEGGGWAQEFADNDRQRQHKQKYMGAEWNWEKIFGKDPRRQQASSSTTTASSTTIVTTNGSVEVVDENDRLRAVALTRLQALFGHLSLLSPQGTSSSLEP
ncbi:hypothetical protein BGZ49_004376, partial [Haplosporangium sp. Z 27]